MIIGIGHRKGVGKDTFAQMLKKRISATTANKVQIVSVSDLLFDASKLLFGWAGAKGSAELNLDYAAKEQVIPGLPPLTNRDMAKLLATFCRDIHPDVLINGVLHNLPKDQITIIPNVRFPNEFKAIKERQGFLIRIDRPSVPEDKLDPFDNALAHEVGWELIIKNNLDLETLEGMAVFIADDFVVRTND